MTATCEDCMPEETDGFSDEDQGWHEGVAIAIQILLPLAIVGVIWGRKSISSKLLIHLDKTYLSVFWPTFSKREKILKWTMTHLPYLEGGLATLWRDGSQLCTLINSVVPGACPNPHRHWRKAPTHGQALAYKYLGVVPVFTDSDFDQRNVTIAIEKTLIDYMCSIQQSISQICHHEELTFSNHYIARGMGLVTGEQYRKTILYIYPNYKKKQSHNLLINIRGPYNTHGTATLFGEDIERLQRSKMIRVSSFDSEPDTAVDNKGFLKNLSSDFQNLLTMKNPKEPSCDIDIRIDIEEDRAKIMFIPRNSGVYEVCLTTNGEHIAGSPYNINIEKNRSGIIDSLDEEDNIMKSKKRSIAKFFERHCDEIILDGSPIKYFYSKYEPRSRLAPLLKKQLDMFETTDPPIKETDEIVVRKNEENNNLSSFDTRSDLTVSDLSKNTSKDETDDDICFLIINENNNNDVVVNNKNDAALANNTSSISIDIGKEVAANVKETIVSNVSLGSSKETVNKARLVKCKAVVDDDISPLPPQIQINGISQDHKADDSLDLRISFLKRKEFWSKISSVNPSLASSSASLNLEQMDFARKYTWFNKIPKHKLDNRRHHSLREIRSSSTRQFRSLDFIDQRRRHRGELAAMREKYGSVDDLNFPSLKDRRDLFLKEIGLHEVKEKKKVVRKESFKTEKVIQILNYFQKYDVGIIEDRVVPGKNIRTYGSIHDKIKLFDNGFKLESPESKSPDSQPSPHSHTDSFNETITKKLKDLPEYTTIKTKIKERFEKAQTFFKTLETGKDHKDNHHPHPKLIVGRRHSLGSNTVRLESTSSSGSLRSLDGSLGSLCKSNSRINGELNSLDYDEVRRLQMSLNMLNNKRRERINVRSVFSNINGNIK